MEDMVQISFLSFCLGLQLRCVSFRFLFQEDLVPFFYTYFRMFSRNIYKRAAENEKYMRILGSWRNKVANEKNLAGQRKYYHFYKCPGCGQRIRIPKGHGKIQIRCPKCNATFIRRS